MTGTVSHLAIDDLTVACMQVGPPAPNSLVFLHGLGDSAILTMQPIARHPILAHRSSLLIDLPGFGHSAAPSSWTATIEDHTAVLSRVFDSLDLQGATLVGHSMGGSLALLLASRLVDADKILTLILAEPLLVREQSELAKAIAKRREDDFVTRGHQMLVRATRRQAARGDRAATGFLQPLEHAEPTILHRSAVSLLADRTPTFLDVLRSLEMPRTLLVGERTHSDLSIVPRNVPIITIPDAGHAMIGENPDAVAEAIANVIG